MAVAVRSLDIQTARCRKIMSSDNPSSTPISTHTNTPLVEIARFLQVVGHRIGLLTAFIVAGGIVGGIWYATATKKYESSAEILVLQTEGNVLDNKGNSEQRQIMDVMPNYQKILVSDEVLDGAIKALPLRHRIDFKGFLKSKWTDVLRKGMSVSSPRLTNVLNVRYVSKNPQTAAFVVGAVVDSYLHSVKQIRRSDSKENLALLTKEKKDLELELQEKERLLLSLKQTSGVLLQGNEKNTNVVIERTIKLNEALVESQKKTLEARAFLDSLRSALESGSDIAQFVQQAAGDVSRELLLKTMGIGSSDVYTVARFEESLVTDRAELKKKEQSFGKNHSQVRQLRDRITSTETWLNGRSQATALAMQQRRDKELGPRLWQMAQQRLNQAATHEAALRREFETVKTLAMDMNNDMAKMEIVELDVRSKRKFYDVVLEQMKRIDMGADSGLRIKVLGMPRVPTNKVSPQISKTVLLCLALGTLFGLGVIYLLDVFDDRFRSPDEMHWQLGLPILAMIRRMDPLPGSGIDQVVTYTHPNGLESESFRTLRSSITFSTGDTQRLVVTSTEPGDGKTTTLANLAVAFAQAGKKTLLIDADMRRPGMTQLFDLKGSQGLSQVLRDNDSVAESCLENIFHLGIERLDFMPSGPRPANPSELLSSDRFSDVIAWAEQIYDQILIDAPPVLAVTDPAIVGRIVDGAVVIVRPDKNRRKMVTRAIDSFRASGVHVLGIVANHLEVGVNSEYGYGYGYGHETPAETDFEDEESNDRRAA